VAAPLSYRERLARKMPRVSKFLRQGIRVVARGRRPATRVVFVVGSQRSGTRLPLQILDGAPEVMTYSEGTAPYFDRVLLKPLPEIERLLTRSLFPVVALKPICETHRINELLDHFPDARGIWIFRDYRDATNSASAKWKSGKEAVRRLAAGELDAAGWRAGGLTTEKLQLVRRLYSDSMSLHAANAVMWFLRNDLFFDLGAFKRSDLVLVRYEDLVTDPRRHFLPVLDRIDVAERPELFRFIYASSVRRRPFPEIPAEIQALCEDAHARLLAHHQAASGGSLQRSTDADAKTVHEADLLQVGAGPGSSRDD
jgi:hypothetical protein